jgi:bifunctional enzyme CysN/CysC
VILIDARKGVLTQTRRHSYLVKLLGIRHVVLAVNKMDLVGWDQATFDAIVADYRAFADQIGLEEIHPDPDLGPDRRQHHLAAARTRPGTTARS